MLLERIAMRIATASDNHKAGSVKFRGPTTKTFDSLTEFATFVRRAAPPHTPQYTKNSNCSETFQQTPISSYPLPDTKDSPCYEDARDHLPEDYFDESLLD